MQPGASAGLGFVTNGVAGGFRASSDTFPNEKGFYRYVKRGTRWCTSGATQTSSASEARLPTPTATTRSFILERSGTTCRPFATVTLESVQQPGEWEVCGQRVQQRLFTVSGVQVTRVQRVNCAINAEVIFETRSHDNAHRSALA